MKKADNEEIQLIWDEINALSPEQREEEYSRLEKQQPDIIQFISEELEGLNPLYLEKAVHWLYFCFKSIKIIHKRKARMPKVNLNLLHEIIDEIQKKVDPDEVDEYCENAGDIFLSHILDLISHLEEHKPKKSFPVIEGDEEITDLEESYQSREYGDDYDIEEKEEEGDDDYVIFREMYDERDTGGYEDEMTDHEYAQYVMFLMFKTIMDAMEIKLEQSEESRRMRAAKKKKEKKRGKGRKSS